MTLGADLVMLAVDERHGTLRSSRQLAFALAAAEMVDLARARRIEATVDGHLKVTESLGTGDPALDVTLGALASCDEGLLLEDVLGNDLPGTIARQVTAVLGSGELAGREVTANLGGQPIYGGLHPADPARRRELIERLTDVAGCEADLAQAAFGALVHIAGLSSPTLRWDQRRARKRLAGLAAWFGDTWRYLPSCPPELALDREDLAPGQVLPADEEPWRMAIRLAVQESGRRVGALPRPSQGGGGLDRDVENASNLAWAYRHGL